MDMPIITEQFVMIAKGRCGRLVVDRNPRDCVRLTHYPSSNRLPRKRMRQ